MPRRAPDHRGRTVLRALELPDPPVFQEPEDRHLFQLLTTGSTVDENVTLAYECWTDDDTRHVLNALLLAKAPDEQIAEGLDLTAAALPPYRALFFDRRVFRHTLDVLNYVQALPVEESTREIYKTAVTQGAAYVINRFRVGARPDIDPKAAVQTVLNDAVDRFLVHRGRALDNAVTKEALRWGQQALSAAQIAIDHSRNTSTALSEFTLALKVVNSTQTAETSGVNPDDVL